MAKYPSCADCRHVDTYHRGISKCCRLAPLTGEALGEYCRKERTFRWPWQDKCGTEGRYFVEKDKIELGGMVI